MSPSRGAGRDDATVDVELDVVAPEEVEPEDVELDVVERDEIEREDGATPIGAAARKRVAVETFARNEAVLRRTAQRYSICADDADDALQRGLEILLNKAPSEDPRDLVRWTQTVVKHEALAVRAERERTLAGPAAETPVPGREDWVAMLPAEVAGPAERAERHEAIERSREALGTLKPQELRALGLLAEGYTYREIAAITGYSSTKVNRAIAEGRERFRHFLLRREGGARCAELAPLISAFADDEAEATDVATLREHLRTCPHCRSTLRAYRAAPGAAAALVPIVPPARGTVVGRLQDAYAAVATRVGGGSGASDSTLGGVAAAGGTRGAGMTALAKVLALCAGTVGGAAACVATGVVPAPLLDSPAHRQAPPAKVADHARHRTEDLTVELPTPYEPEPSAEEAAVEPDPQAQEAAQPGEEGHQRESRSKPDPERAPVEEAIAATPPSESGATEYTESPAPVEATASASSSSPSGAGSSAASSSSGSAAGEFGP
ncbi:MAG: sigma-70 family RNA polymerase sigma factor [Actinobacteria bacterium]|nr:sigma-70 family RNA polymerase sigma factor [Actinomycetota bacterium]